MKGYYSAPVEQCGNCRHFVRHYHQTTPNKYYPLDLGHCTFPMCKNRRVEENCPHWSPAEDPCA